MRKCPDSFDYSVGSSCFKYVDGPVFQRAAAKQYCQSEYGGQLAVLDSEAKMEKTIKFLHKKFDEEYLRGGTPTAWTDGTWIKDTITLRYDNGVVDPNPQWMTPIFNHRTKTFFHWPTTLMFGEDSDCVAVALWKKGHPAKSIPARAGLYNLPCEDFVYTHPLCEISV